MTNTHIAAEPARLTIAIPCYNQAHFLSDAISSILESSPEDTDLLVVDDGSTIGDPAAVSAAFGVRCIRQTNLGRSAAKNRALRESNSEFISFLDADDLYRPGAITAALAALQAHPQDAFVYGRHAVVSAGRQSLWVSPAIRTDDLFLELLKTNFIAMHATVFYRRSILVAAGGFDETLPACEDYDVYLKLSLAHSASFYDCVAAEYRRHEANTTKHSALMLRESLRVLSRYRSAASKSSAHRAAFRTGVRWWRSYYGDRLASDIVHQVLARQIHQPLASLKEGLALDPCLMLRISVAAGRTAISGVARHVKRQSRRDPGT